MRIQKTFRYRLSPTKEQEQQFRRFAGLPDLSLIGALLVGGRSVLED